MIIPNVTTYCTGWHEKAASATPNLLISKQRREISLVLSSFRESEIIRFERYSKNFEKGRKKNDWGKINTFKINCKLIIFKNQFQFWVLQSIINIVKNTQERLRERENLGNAVIHYKLLQDIHLLFSKEEYLSNNLPKC